MATTITESSKERRNICGGKLYPPIDVNDDRMMVELGLRLPTIQRNISVFKKEQWEKDQLKRERKKKYPLASGSAHIPEKEERVQGKLIIYYRNTNKLPNFKTTESVRCFKSEIEGILRDRRDLKLSISKTYFNY